MADFIESPVYEAGIYRKEQTDPVLGGLATNPANISLQQLSNRTAYFKARLDNSGIENAKGETSNVNNCVAAGFHWVLNSSSNRPPGELNGHVFVSGTSSSNLVQIWISQNSDKMYMRRATAGPTFSTWKPINLSGVDDLVVTVGAYLNGWDHVTGSDVIFAKVGNTVRVRGRLEGGQTNLPLFAVAPEMWPSEARQVPVASNNGSVWVFSLSVDGSTSVSNGGAQQEFPGILNLSFSYDI